MSGYAEFVEECIENCNTNGELLTSNNAEILLRKLAAKLDELYILWYEDIEQIADTNVNGATYYKVVDNVITDQTVTLDEFLAETNWGERSYMLVGLSPDNEHYWAGLACGGISWYNTKSKYAFESNAGFVEILDEKFPIPIIDGRTEG